MADPIFPSYLLITYLFQLIIGGEEQNVHKKMFYINVLDMHEA